MSGTIRKAADNAAIDRYEALLRVSQTLISIRSSEELFRLLARELRAVVKFYVMGVGIYDEHAHEVHLKSYGEPADPLQVPKLTPEETFTWWVYQHQQPLIIPSLDAETRFPAVAEMLKNRGVRSVCALPLTTANRRLGGLAVGSTEVDAYSSEEVKFLSLVANQVALAVDDALNFDTSQHAQEALRASEKSFRLIVDSIPGLVLTMSAEGKLEFVSQQGLDYSGKTLDGLKSWSTSDIVHPDDLSRVLDTWRHSVETGHPAGYDSEYRIRRADGVYRWFQVRALPVRDTEGRVIRWYCLHTDIDDRKRGEEALRASEQRLRLVVDTIPGLVASMNAAGEAQLLNRQLLEYFGRTPEELKSWATSGIVHPDDLAGVIATHTASIETGNPYDIEYRLRRADGEYRWFQVRNHPVRDTEGRVISWYVLLTDIDKRKQAEDQLQLLLDVTNQVVSNLQLQDLLRAISMSIRRVMHCDLVSVCFPDPELKRFQTFVLDFPESKGFIREEFFTPIEGSLSGLVFRTRKPWIGNASDVLQLGLKDEAAIPEGLKTGCILPLVSRDRILGVLSLARREENAFSQADVEFLSQVANQIAIAVENTSAYHEITQARTELENALGEIEHRTEDLRRSESYLAEAQKLTHTGSWAWNVRTGLLFWSQEIYRIYGFDRPAIGPTWEQFLQRVHPEDRPDIERRAKMETTQKDWVDSQADFRIVLPDGRIKRLHSIAHPVMDEYGEITEVVGTVMDVTEQWNARNALEKALEEIQGLKDRLQDENLVLREQIDQAFMFEEIVGASPALRAVLSRVSKVAPTDSTVLLTGETGTGKELIARAIHKRSRRSSRAFVSVSCAAVPASLIASELFGHEKGAFTGAMQRRLGRFELADEGTLFLDEVGELPAETQITLLRVLQEREFERVGGNQRIRANVRVIAATNRDLDSAIGASTFRSDLFYRLNVFPIEIPPLRDRKEDIPLLVEYFIDHFARKAGKSFRGINKKTLNLLQAYPWPGNIRELQNLVERSVIVCDTENFSVDERWLFRQSLPTESKGALELSPALAAQERELIEVALRESGGRVSGPSGAAAKLGIHRSTLESKIASLKIDKYRFKTASASKNG
jgi:PAS domain S-box-containing protein